MLKELGEPYSEAEVREIEKTEIQIMILILYICFFLRLEMYSKKLQFIVQLKMGNQLLALKVNDLILSIYSIIILFF